MAKVLMTAVILAGGKSSRMGQDKALLEWGNQPMLEMLAERFNSIFSETLIIVNDRDRYAHLQLGKSAVHVDLFKDQGPLAGLYTGLAHASHQTCFVFTCDMPFVDESFIREFAGFWQEGDGVLCVEAEDSRPQPFPGIYHREARGLAHILLEGKERSMQQFLRVAQVRVLTLKKEKISVLANMNTPEDYHRVLSEKCSHI